MHIAPVIIAVMFTLVACGGGGGGGSPSPSMSDMQRPSGPPDASNNQYQIHPGLTASDAKRSPIYRTGNLLRVGIDQGAGPERLPRAALTGLSNVEVRYGTINDGAGRSDLQSYLSSVASSDQYTGLMRRLAGYEVRVIGSSTAEERSRVLAAVQLVNAAMPEGAKLSVGAPIPAFSLKDTVNSNGLYFGFNRELPNTIHVEFAPVGEFYDDEAAGTSWGEYILLSRGNFPAYMNERFAVILMAHELLHSLGIDGHVPIRFDSIMEAGNGVYSSSQGRRQPGSLLYPVDREALRALYGPLLNSSDPQRLGPWANSSEHFFVGSEHVAFGVAMRNRSGYAEPWAYGVKPDTDLASNRQLSGSAAWIGALVGFTPSAKRVVGDAGITVNLTSMAGSAAFTSLATIETDGQMPQWGDGNLRYTIAVRGNTFRETGGDDGRLTGIFAGRSHEAVGGTLERSDLTAAFGGSR